MALADLAACTRMVQAYDPDSLAAGTDTSAEIDVRGYYEALLIVNIGDMGSSATLDCKIQAASTRRVLCPTLRAQLSPNRPRASVTTPLWWAAFCATGRTRSGKSSPPSPPPRRSVVSLFC